ncbi:GNAT family N-acetyltransferase [Enterococcus casseliflavus]|uniref:GNAT family N-acetyltransferase n=1 Tax=Enterococcus casseliflavus TaxID=37734 RepID=UPI00191B72E0|nr:GNAT family N-acetyltransferase [Enterococcus casseliflavus]QQU15263.1 GNAT family N-acetyltransferase [Enterococcus casseliflavus]
MIRPITPNEAYPWVWLLDADPEKAVVESYLYNSQTLVYEEAGEMIGVLVYQNQGKNWEIMNVAVSPEKQGMGIGRQLLQAAEEAILSQHLGAKRPIVVIKTGSLPSAALTLYQKQGYVEKERVKNYFTTHYVEPIFENGQQLFDQVILEKQL